MRYYNHLYQGQGIDNIQKYIEKLNGKAPLLNVYVLVLCERKNDSLEIIDSAYLHQNTISNQDDLIVGITKGYENALLLVEEIVQEVYDKTKGVNIKQYIAGKMSERV